MWQPFVSKTYEPTMEQHTCKVFIIVVVLLVTPSPLSSSTYQHSNSTPAMHVAADSSKNFASLILKVK